MAISTVSLPRDLRINNKKLILKAFLKNGLQSINDVSQFTGISRQTVKKCVEYYLGKGFLIDVGKGESSEVGGKRPELFDVNPKLKIACVTLHHHDVQIHVLNFKYQILASWSSEPVRPTSLDMLSELLMKGKEEIASEICWGDVVGLDFSGPIQITEDGILKNATPFPDWPEKDKGRSILEILLNIFEISRIQLYSDGVAAGGAVLQQNEKYQEEGVVLTVYTEAGIGGSLFQNGKGMTGYKSEAAIGHIIVEGSDSATCECGAHGCLESMVNRKRRTIRLQNQKEDFQKSCLCSEKIENVTFEDIFMGSENGDSFCRREVKYYAEMYARALQSVLVVSGADLIVFQGDFGYADQIFDETLKESLSKCKFCSGDLFPDIGYDRSSLFQQEAIGMMYLTLQDFLENPDKYY